ncbi:YcgN family cysteine cluster protein [Granulosicoccus antarcticus]|uniref:UPF0260 protein IMCC3135_10325 n=1 Tax=Granulosicoccus antarcticus IMCC3135 TaxID=1192854 RepID=A0A2Z2NLW3_9GAMM|nr:YcgN family cysteine cluster protein [Granulosicoccus antarcticus]ASJ72159.1 hypothetical protein IMCC3135_10325 [Granulosicoccus antarcticus IMCC3135]
MSKGDRPFWEDLSLDDMSDEQWESLCDRCGRCCLQKLEDEDTEEVWFTRISCRQLNTQTGRCKDYAGRFQKVPDCLAVRPITAEKIRWLPVSCAYRKLAVGDPLESWHPLISGRSESVVEAGIGVAGQCVSENNIPVAEYFRYVVHWDEEGGD